MGREKTPQAQAWRSDPVFGSAELRETESPISVLAG